MKWCSVQIVSTCWRFDHVYRLRYKIDKVFTDDSNSYRHPAPLFKGGIIELWKKENCFYLESFSLVSLTEQLTSTGLSRRLKKHISSWYILILIYIILHPLTPFRLVVCFITIVLISLLITFSMILKRYMLLLYIRLDVFITSSNTIKMYCPPFWTLKK